MNLIREREREREREQRNLKFSLNSVNAKDLGDSTQDSTDSTQDSPHSTPQTSLQNYKKLDYESLSDDEKSEGYVFHILSDFVSDDSRQKLSNLAKELSKIYPCEIMIHICDDSVFEGIDKWRENDMGFFRVLIPDILPKHIKICLYLDVDMLVHNDLRELFSLDLQMKYAGVVCAHIHTFGVFARNQQKQNKIFWFKNFYFNSGFLFLNLNEWRKNNLKDKILDFASRHDLSEPDQSALNAIISKENALILPYEYNMFIAVIYHSGFNWIRKRLIYKIPYTETQIKYAHLNPMVWHFVDAIDKPWNGCVSGIDDKGKVLEIYWWETAWNTPFFNDELKALFATKRDNYLVCKDFGLYVASLIDECSKNFVGYMKMPFIVYKAFSEFDLNKNYANDFSESLDRNMAFELLSVAVRAWGKKNRFERIAKFIILPFRIYCTKNRCKKGIFKAQKGNVISGLYVD